MAAFLADKRSEGVQDRRETDNVDLVERIIDRLDYFQD